MRSFFSVSRSPPSERIRQITTSVALTAWEMMVASATPSTSMCSTITKNRFSITFSAPAIIR